MNPFTFGNPIKDPDRFYGRRAEIRQIVNRLLSSAHESTSIIGERRIGKTSLLYYLGHPQVSAGLGLTPDKFCLVYADFQGLTDITPLRFWQRVLKMMSHSVCDESLRSAIQRLSTQTEIDLFDLEDIFQASQDKGLTTVLMMDEFEYVTENENFKTDFFGGLRALAIHHGVALLPATRRELADLCYSEEIKGSPFFNIFANVVLRPFSHFEVEQMLAGYSAAAGERLEPDDRKWIWGMGGGHPFFVQMAGHYLVDGRAQGLKGADLSKFAEAHFEEQAEAHYGYIWSHCTENEKISLIILRALLLQKPSKKTSPTLENLVRIRPRAPQDMAALEKRGLVVESGGLYSIFSTSLEKWIKREIQSIPGEEESKSSAEEWVRSGRHEGLKPAAGLMPHFKKQYWPLMADVAKELSLEFAAAGVLELLKLLV